MAIVIHQQQYLNQLVEAHIIRSYCWHIHIRYAYKLQIIIKTISDLFILPHVRAMIALNNTLSLK